MPALIEPPPIDDAVRMLLREIDLTALESEVELIFSDSAGKLEDATIRRMASRAAYQICGKICLALFALDLAMTIEDACTGRHRPNPKRDSKLKCAWAKFKAGRGFVPARKLWGYEDAGERRLIDWAETHKSWLNNILGSLDFGPRIDELIGSVIVGRPVSYHGKLFNDFQKEILKVLHSTHFFSLDQKRTVGKARSKRN